MRAKGIASNSGRNKADIDALPPRVVVGGTGSILAETDEVALIYALPVVELIQL
jgi:hypothetical protein